MSKKFVITQLPNWQLIVMFVGWLGTKLTEGQFATISRTVFYIGGIIWAYEEIFRGENWFRKTLGVLVMLWLAFSLAQNLV